MHPPLSIYWAVRAVSPTAPLSIISLAQYVFHNYRGTEGMMWQRQPSK